MKLLEMFPRASDPVRDDSGTPIAHFSAQKGHVLDLEGGIVTVSGKGFTNPRWVPMSNVGSVTPAPVEKPAKGK